ncbi:MAG: hypothetical protein DWQ07_24520 [Chloroflexi bacterium]|nr:MAG: hypothetical protein DWQ07_24520 [Chloroflexota bacterium]MBL1196298.1 hypothetical protein [Chloroflexota bacterium]NOH13593.1 hypothetical protein [Chloroflexota bacterium]
MRTWLFISVVLLLAACAPAQNIEAPDTTTPTGTATLTPTIVWFPPTHTSTPFPTLELTPTPDLRPNLGDTILEEDFEDGGQWSLVESESATSAITNNHLTLTLRQDKSYLLTNRSTPFLGNFYTEVTASPQLCRGADEYGMLVRVMAANSYYRFSLSCDGRAKVERLVNGVASSMAPWTFHGIIPQTAPSSVRLGVWASGQELRFFVGEHFLFTVQDTVFFQGGLGLFVRTAESEAITVTFSDLLVREIDRAASNQ